MEELDHKLICSSVISDTVARSIVFFLVPNFSITSFASALEPLQIANRLLGHKYYGWRSASMDGEPVKSSCGVEIKVDSCLKEERIALSTSQRPSNMFLYSGEDVQQYSNNSLYAYLRENKNSGVTICGMSTAAYLMATAGLLKHKQCVIHWDILPGFAERFSDLEVRSDIYNIDGNLWTCAGSTAALDLTLSFVEKDLGKEIVVNICQELHLDRVRQSNERQRNFSRNRRNLRNRTVLACIKMMEENISEPLEIDEIVKKVGLSRRQIERLFKRHLRYSPARYYLEIRLENAHSLLRQSSMPIVEVAISCGFISASHFTKCYGEMYGRTPMEERTE